MSNNLLLYYPKTRPKSFYIDKTDVENDFLNLNLSISNQFSTTNWFEKSQSQISTTGSEFNSILSNTDLFNLNKYYINLAVIIKLI